MAHHGHMGAHPHHGRKVHGGHKHQGGGHPGSHHAEQGYDKDAMQERPKVNKRPAQHSNETALVHRGSAPHIGSHKGHDAAAHPSFHAANKEHGLDHDFAPAEGYMNGGHDHHLGNNIAHED